MCRCLVLFFMTLCGIKLQNVFAPSDGTTSSHYAVFAGQKAAAPRSKKFRCPICLSKRSVDKYVRCSRCSHGFCRKCEANLLKHGHSNCPLCRAPMAGAVNEESIRRLIALPGRNDIVPEWVLQEMLDDTEDPLPQWAIGTILDHKRPILRWWFQMVVDMAREDEEEDEREEAAEEAAELEEHRQWMAASEQRWAVRSAEIDAEMEEKHRIEWLKANAEEEARNLERAQRVAAAEEEQYKREAEEMETHEQRRAAIETTYRNQAAADEQRIAVTKAAYTQQIIVENELWKLRKIEFDQCNVVEENERKGRGLLEKNELSARLEFERVLYFAQQDELYLAKRQEWEQNLMLTRKEQGLTALSLTQEEDDQRIEREREALRQFIVEEQKKLQETEIQRQKLLAKENAKYAEENERRLKEHEERLMKGVAMRAAEREWEDKIRAEERNRQSKAQEEECEIISRRIDARVADCYHELDQRSRSNAQAEDQTTQNTSQNSATLLLAGVCTVVVAGFAVLANVYNSTLKTPTRNRHLS